MALINRDRLKSYLDIRFNVLFKGRHGVGKTAMITSLFNEAFGPINQKWLYFSASTMDPWVDFVGVPKVVGLPGEENLKLIRPAVLQNDQIEGIFFDEFNRAPDKVLNATMELIQFKSINGHQLKNLKVIWAAINPEDEADTYTVNHLDPAHLDRFQVHMDIPYELDEEYFRGKYPDQATTFMEWWNAIPDELRFFVSPRRLDYAIQAFNAGCRMEDILPKESNPKKLRDMLKILPFGDILKKIVSPEEATKFLKDVNNTTRVLDLVKYRNKEAIAFFTRFATSIPQELNEPFKEYLYARKKGFEEIVSIEDLAEKLQDIDKGTVTTAALINTVNLDAIYSKGGTLDDDIRTLSSNSSKKNLISVIVHRLCDVIQVAQAGKLEQIMWGLKGKEKGSPTNFHRLLVSIAKISGTLFSDAQRDMVNAKLTRYKITEKPI